MMCPVQVGPSLGDNAVLTHDEAVGDILINTWRQALTCLPPPCPARSGEHTTEHIVSNNSAFANDRSQSCLPIGCLKQVFFSMAGAAMGTPWGIPHGGSLGYSPWGIPMGDPPWGGPHSGPTPVRRVPCKKSLMVHIRTYLTQPNRQIFSNIPPENESTFSKLEPRPSTSLPLH